MNPKRYGYDHDYGIPDHNGKLKALEIYEAAVEIQAEKTLAEDEVDRGEVPDFGV